MARKNLDDVIYGDRTFSRTSKLYDFGSGGGSLTGRKDKYDYHSTQRCYHKHPPLKLPGTELVIYGGSCSSPAVSDADVYIGFDSSMTFTGRNYPWREGTEFLFKIRDMDVPLNPAEFKKLVSWTKGQLEAGKKVHCGCIGGHGRTGTFLAALCSEFGEKDAIKYVRENYCYKAVESQVQVKFLQEHFGVKAAEGAKHGKGGKKAEFATGLDKIERFQPVSGNGCIWDRK